MRAIYLHGFASGPGSSKGRFFSDRLSQLGWQVEMPDLTEGAFEHSTLSQQLRVVERLTAREPAVLLGSSLGGYLAALFATRRPQRVSALVLLAPALGFARRWGATLGEQAMNEWRERGVRSVYHYGEERQCDISYDLVRDGLRYEDFPNVTHPALVLHGRRDDTVDHRLSEEFARGRPNVELVLFNSDHQLLDVLEPMWRRVREFLSGGAWPAET